MWPLTSANAEKQDTKVNQELTNVPRFQREAGTYPLLPFYAAS
jgi:hypothetical protein